MAVMDIIGGFEGFKWNSLVLILRTTGEIWSRRFGVGDCKSTKEANGKIRRILAEVERQLLPGDLQ